MKPKSGMFFEAAKKWNIDLSESFLVGDTADDLGAAKAAGVKSILIEYSYNDILKPDFKITGLEKIEEIILE